MTDTARAPLSSSLDPTRRTVLRAAGATGALAITVAACGSGGAAVPAAVKAGTTLAKVTDVPVGGGIVLTDPQLVVTQPTPGTFMAFSSICTHAGCPVTSVEGGAIVCPCHGSHFAIDTGKPTAGPAQSALPAQAVTVSGGTVVTG